MMAIALLGAATAQAQAGKLPPFRMVQANGKIFRAEDLPIGKPIVIIYFSPDCDHCDQLVKELLKRKADFNKASIAMITYLPVDPVTKFVKAYDLNSLPNIYVGTEGSTYFLKNYYQLTSMPFMALYTKNGDLVKQYPKDEGLTDLINQLKNLQ